MGKYKRFIYIWVAVMIVLSIILFIKIKTKPKYNYVMYEEIYGEYEDIFEKDNIKETISSNTQEINKVIENSKNSKTELDYTTNYIEEGRIFGKIVIPQIDISCPIIKETTTEYLKIAPTKYCGPEVNEIRKFSYSRS